MSLAYLPRNIILKLGPNKTSTLVRDPKWTKHARIIVNSVLESLSHDL